MMMICHVFLNVIITMSDDSGGHGLGDDILVEVIDILLFLKKNTIFFINIILTCSCNDKNHI
jgi:hypothetical protein